MKCIINDHLVLSQPPEGPLGVHIASFARWANGQGYASYSVYRRVLLASCFSRWLGEKGVGLRSISSAHPSQYLRFRARRVRIRADDAIALRQFMDFLRRDGVIPAEKTVSLRLCPAEQQALEFERYLRDERGLASVTILNYVPFIRRFLKDRFGDGRVTLSRLRADDVVRFVRHEAPRLHVKRAKLLTTALRSFLQYARYRGDTTLDLASAVPCVANWAMSSIPRAISEDCVRQLLDSIDRGTATGRRDYAILLLLARLGLRAGEVVSLKLDDIDWTAGRMNVCGKSGRPTELPLPTDVGEAIVAYLQNGRPPTTSRRVFLRCKAPIRGFLGPSAVSSLVRHALERAGIEAPTKGAHQFRHALATQMLRRGASLAQIGELLGHRSPETTKIYTQVDLDALRTLAAPWPGGVR